MIYTIETYVDDEERSILVKTPFNVEGEKIYLATFVAKTLQGQAHEEILVLKNVSSVEQAFKVFDEQIIQYLKEKSENSNGDKL